LEDYYPFLRLMVFRWCLATRLFLFPFDFGLLFYHPLSRTASAFLYLLIDHPVILFSFSSQVFLEVTVKAGYQLFSVELYQQLRAFLIRAAPHQIAADHEKDMSFRLLYTAQRFAQYCIAYISVTLT
jgi:hypothetical protein